MIKLARCGYGYPEAAGVGDTHGLEETFTGWEEIPHKNWNEKSIKIKNSGEGPLATGAHIVIMTCR